MALHNAARKAGLTFNCNVTYLEIPVCTGYDDDGSPIVELKGWPFLLPSDMEPWTYSPNFLFPTLSCNEFLHLGFQTNVYI